METLGTTSAKLPGSRRSFSTGPLTDVTGMVHHRICQILAGGPRHTGLARCSLQYLEEHRGRLGLGKDNGVNLVIPIVREPEHLSLCGAAVLLVLRQRKEWVEVFRERDLEVKHRDAAREPELLGLDATSRSQPGTKLLGRSQTTD